MIRQSDLDSFLTLTLIWIEGTLSLSSILHEFLSLSTTRRFCSPHDYIRVLNSPSVLATLSPSVPASVFRADNWISYPLFSNDSLFFHCPFDLIVSSVMRSSVLLVKIQISYFFVTSEVPKFTKTNHTVWSAFSRR